MPERSNVSNGAKIGIRGQFRAYRL